MTKRPALKTSQVAEIKWRLRQLYLAQERGETTDDSQRQIAIDFGISDQDVHQIKQGYHYGWVSAQAHKPKETEETG